MTDTPNAPDPALVDPAPATVSARKRAANRANAQRSTGPRTAAGKAHSALNALVHGVLSRRMVLPDEDPAEFAAFADQWRAHLAPGSPVEDYLVVQIIGVAWRLARVAGAEAAILRRRPQRTVLAELLAEEGRAGSGPREDDSGIVEFPADALANISRYETHLERRFIRLLRELEHAQAVRARQPVHSVDSE